MTLTLEQIRQQGLEALRQRLGRAGMIRFLQQFDRGQGNYARDRQAWADETTLAEISALAEQRRPRRVRRGDPQAGES